MAVPTIARITPATGPTGGRRVIKVWGSNFQLAPPPPAQGIAPTPNPSVAVLFGTEPAREVRVMASSLLHVTTPSHDPGTVNLTVKNIDQDGVDVPGESVTKTAAYTFARPSFTRSRPQDQSNLTRLVRTLILMLQREVIANTVETTHTDFDDDIADGANVAALAEVPGLVVSGPFLKLNRFYSTNQPREKDDADGETFTQYPPRTVDLNFTIIAVDELMTRALDLVAETTACFLRNPTIRMLRDPAVPGDYVEYELEIEQDGDFKSVGAPNNSNIRAFSGTVVIRGFDIEDEDMAMVSAPAVRDVLPSGAASETSPSAVTFVGQPGVTTAGPIPSGPAPAPGTPGPIHQIPPEE